MRRLSILQRMPLAPVPYSEGDQHPAALPCRGRAVERGFFRNREGEFICRSNLGGTDSISACSSWFGFPQTPPCCRQHYQTPHPHCIPGILRQIFCFHLVTKVISLHCLNEAFTLSVKAPFPLLFFGLFHFISGFLKARKSCWGGIPTWALPRGKTPPQKPDFVATETCKTHLPYPSIAEPPGLANKSKRNGLV